MIIENHDIQMQSYHTKSDRLNRSQKVEFSVNTEEAEATSTALEVLDVNLEISRQAMAKFNRSIDIQSSVNKTQKNQESSDENLEMTDKWSIARHMLEKFFGIKVEIVKPEDFDKKPHKQPNSDHNSQSLPAPQVEFRIDVTEIREHEEHVSFQAGGTVTTSDGREIRMDARLEMSKETLETIRLSLSAGNGQTTDPLVLNMDGRGAALSSDKFDFDLDMDGENELISFLEQGSGFLVLDKNQNGIVDDGSELFGPSTDNGFEELQNYDRDNNQWIDENDSIFFNLSLWTRDRNGNDHLSTLTENNVGAIYLGRALTPFEMNGGQLRETGIFLNEDGETHLIQEIDLRV